MDVRSNFRAFEESISNYTGDDPLDPWDRYIHYLEKMLSASNSRDMSFVLDRLVQRFLPDERYFNDIRYINYCIRCASYYEEPINLYSHIYSKGIGTRAAVLYVAWAQQFEQQGQLQQADMVFQRAIENQAEPADTVLQQYRMFKSRLSRSGASEGVRNPLKDSHFVNQLQSHREAGPQSKDTEDLSQLPADRTVRIISRSENAVVKKPSQGKATSIQTVSMYRTEDLLCEGSELCFEEVRATRYFVKRSQEEKQREFDELQRRAREQDEEVMRMKQLLENLETNLIGSATCQGGLASASPVQHAPCTPAARVNSESLRQSFQNLPPLNNTTIRSTSGWRQNSERDPRRSTEPETHLLCERSGASVASNPSSQRSISPSAQLRRDNSSCSRSLHMPEAAVGHFQEYREATETFAPWAYSLQAPLFPPQPVQNPKPFGLAAQMPAGYRPEESKPGGVLHQGGVSQLSSLLHQYDSREHRETSASEAPELEVKLDVSQGGTGNLSHITPNTSLGLVHATPSRVLPSPTVNTREALDAIMDMFQAPNLLQEEHFPSSMSMHQAGKSFDAGYQATGIASSFSKQPSAAPFAIFQDENDDKENCSAVAVKPPRALVEIPVSKIQKQNESQSELMPDESTMWGGRYNSLNSVAACPNSTRDFALLAQLVSTPFQNKAPYSWDCERDQENGDQIGFGGPEEGAFLRQPTKLSPIIEQSPPDGLSETGTECSMRAPGFAEQGTIVGEGLAQRSLATEVQSFRDQTEVQHHAPTTLSFRDQTEVQHHAPTTLSFRDQTEVQHHAPTTLSFRDQTEVQHHAPTTLSFRDQTEVRHHAPTTTLSFRDQTEVRHHAPTTLSFRDQTEVQHHAPTTLSFRDQTEVQHHAPTTLSFRDQTEVQHHAPTTTLSFRDQTASLVHTEGAVAKSPPPKYSKPDWDVYVSPEKPVIVPSCPLSQRAAGAEALHSTSRLYVSANPVKPPTATFDTPMSPGFAPLSDWLVVKIPEVTVEPDLDLEAFMSPRQGLNTMDIPMSPERPKLGLDVAMTSGPRSPTALNGRHNMDIPMSPDCGAKFNVDVPMSPAAAAESVSNPWDEDLILSLLSKLPNPLDSLPNVITWECKVPNIAPKMTIKMGDGSLRVDCVLGLGAFATVYQATDLTTSEKIILKVQKPANPWEFYINTQLNARMQPNVRHLFNNFHSAHLFQNGSVLLGELHNCGTLLNAVNLYKNMSDKVMPQPLVVYFTICILHMVEQLHRVHIIHADIKPDNFLLGERFLENKSFDPDNMDHGLALIDLGQSIDMTLFPEGTAFTAKCLTSGFQCTEMQSGRPWTYQTDYFGIAGTVYCMIFGTYMQVKREDGVWKTNAVFRRNPLSEVWTEFFHILLNVPNCHSLPCLRSLRCRLSDVLQQNYSSKLSSLKTRLVIQLLESRSARR
ncbi:hypothetical protein DPEC_G00083350 [Dallia pectoralis]|uniref:Uncharacterized protein n=1 Tax=Dallia pectoralis TaxID=75939 RepID=A0ACC2GZ07_DALPE|nr:hypothetical protein DPEC_G00083350 [Dallia pectoralis]